MKKIYDLTGQKYGRLTALSLAEQKVYPNGQKKTFWRCRCDCGKELIVAAGDLRNGHTRSCGCLKEEVNHESLRTHGHSGERLHNIWNNIKQRCYNPKGSGYALYGGRGIKMCDEWRNDYMAFRNWSMSNGYADDLSIDRIDYNGDYEPNNCRWVNRLVQSNNTRRNVFYNYGGESHTAPEWARLVGMNEDTLYNRLHYYGWDIEHALFTPVSTGNRWSTISRNEINHQLDKQPRCTFGDVATTR